MASKWKKFKDKMPAFELDKSWQQKIDVEKKELTETFGHNKVSLAQKLSQVRNEKSQHEAEISTLNTTQEALYQLLADLFEDEDIDSFQSSGTTYYQKFEPYCTVDDRKKFFQWIKAQRMSDLLSVNFQTLNAMCKGMLEEGKKLPPGIKAFIKTKIGSSGGSTTAGNKKGETNGANENTTADAF